MILLYTILSGLQVAGQLIAAYFVLRIALLWITPSLPYIMLFIGILLRAVSSIPFVSHLIQPHERIIIQIVTSALMAVSFIMIFRLINKKI